LVPGVLRALLAVRLGLLLLGRTLDKVLCWVV
jgi:hypothetical protein